MNTKTNVKRRKKSFSRVIRKALYKAVYKLACVLDSVDQERVYESLKAIGGQILISFFTWCLVFYLISKCGI